MNVIYPVFPLYFSIHNISEKWFGILGAGYSITSAIFGIVFAKNLLKIKGKFILGLLIIFGVLQLSFIFNMPIFILFISRVLSGIIIGGCLVVSSVMLLQINSNNKKMILALSLATGIFGLGNACGFLIGGICARINYLLPFYSSVIISILAGLVILFFKDDIDYQKYQKININKGLIISISIFASTIISFSLIGAMIPFLMNKVYQSSPIIIGFFMFSYGLLGMIVNSLLNPLLKKNFDIINVVIISTVLGIVSLTLYLIFNTLFVYFIIFIMFYLLIISLLRPPLSNLLINNINNQKEAIAISNFIMYSSTVIGNIIVSIFYQIDYKIVVIISIIFLLISFLIALSGKLKEKL